MQVTPELRGTWVGARARTERITPAALIIALSALGLGLRVYCLLRPGYLMGVTEYDDGSYFGSAIRLAQGQLPYRDFVFVQPPGITLLMVPAALLAKVTGTAWGLAIGRILTMLAGTASIALAGLLVRHRGRLAVIVACGICAVHPDAIFAAHTVLVEPWLVLFCLIGALALFDGDRLASGRRRVVWAGAAFGFAGVVEAWAIVPVLVLLVLTVRQRRRAVAFAAGVAAGFAVPTLPFLALAPGSFYRSVITAQVGSRLNATSVYSLYRIRLMAGLSDFAHPPALLVLLVTALACGFVALGSVAAWSRLDQPPLALDWYVAVTGGLMGLIFLWPPQFHYHFVGFLVPFLAMAVGLTAARVVQAASAGPPRLAAAARSGPVAVAVVLLLAAGVVQFHYETSVSASVTPAQLAAARRVIPPGACVLADEVSYAVLADRFVTSVRDCPEIDDGTGVNYALSHGLNTGTGAAQVPSVAALWHSAFARAQFIWLSVHAYKRIPWTPDLQGYFHAHFMRVPGLPDLRLYRRRG
ncbi:MAG: glycosyltransferase 87 family protein [Streptosporangiaceae bacterium]